jgi:hypothetical protein
VRSSITSRSSPLGSVSAPSADSHHRSHAEWCVAAQDFGLLGPQLAAGARSGAENSKKLVTRRHHQSQLGLCIPLCANCGQIPDERPDGPQPRPIPNRCTRTTQSVPVSYTTRPARRAAQTSCCPHLAQALLLLLKSLRSLFFRKGCWGRAVPHPGFQASKTLMSLIPISFQERLRRSTVVVRQPDRSSECLRARASVGGNHEGWSR